MIIRLPMLATKHKAYAESTSLQHKGRQACVACALNSITSACTRHLMLQDGVRGCVDQVVPADCRHLMQDEAL